MSKGKHKKAAEPLFEIDRKARKLFKPYRKSRAVKTLHWFGDVGDQPQLRLLSIGVLVLGLARSDERMMRAGTRMLLSHELATFAKNAVKRSVDRSRPRSASGTDGHKPRRGRDNSKEETSFPSGHSAGAMTVACAFAAEYPEHRGPALTAAGAVGLAQVPTCAHYPSDVAAGWVIGAAADAAVGLLWRQLFRR